MTTDCDTRLAGHGFEFYIGKFNADLVAQARDMDGVKEWIKGIDAKLDQVIEELAKTRGGNYRMGEVLKSFAIVVSVLATLGTAAAGAFHFVTHMGK